MSRAPSRITRPARRIPAATSAHAAATRLLARQRFGVLATTQAGEPHTSLVAFAVTADRQSVVFATPRATRKYANLRSEPRVALLIDNRSNRASDVRSAAALTIVGRVVEPRGVARAALHALYLARHPGLAGFVQAPGTALCRIAVSRYVIVDRFQHVRNLEPEALGRRAPRRRSSP